MKFLPNGDAAIKAAIVVVDALEVGKVVVKPLEVGMILFDAARRCEEFFDACGVVVVHALDIEARERRVPHGLNGGHRDVKFVRAQKGKG